MKLGIIADTHDNVPMFKKAVILFNDEKVGMVLHAGDYVAPFAVWCLKSLNCDYVGVLGNNDGEKDGLKQTSEGRIKTSPQLLNIDGKRILLTHSLDCLAEPIEVIEENGEYDLVIYGHTHNAEISRRKNVLLVNPGEAGGWLRGSATVAIVDTQTMTAEIKTL